MSVNVPVPLPATRRPRASIVLNGTRAGVADGLVSFDVEQNAFYTADRFTAELALSKLPRGLDASFWSSTIDISTQILVSFLDQQGREGPATSLIIGRVDEVDYDPVLRKVTLHGRDRTADLIETKTTEKFVNQTASAIAAKFALEHGLTPIVTKTTASAGTYYERDYASLALEASQWDILTFLAEKEGFAVYVSGNTLYFGPGPSESDNPYVLQWTPRTDGGPPSANLVDLKMSRTLTLAKDITVKVLSWNQKQSNGFSVTVRAQGAKKTAAAGGKGQIFTYRLPNATRDQALKFGQARLADLSRHERVIKADLPGDPALTMQTMVKLIGTGTDWDQAYYPDTINFRMSPDEGFRMELRAKNHSPESVVQL